MGSVVDGGGSDSDIDICGGLVGVVMTGLGGVTRVVLVGFTWFGRRVGLVKIGEAGALRVVSVAIFQFRNESLIFSYSPGLGSAAATCLRNSWFF